MLDFELLKDRLRGVIHGDDKNPSLVVENEYENLWKEIYSKMAAHNAKRWQPVTQQQLVYQEPPSKRPYCTASKMPSFSELSPNSKVG